VVRDREPRQRIGPVDDTYFRLIDAVDMTPEQRDEAIHEAAHRGMDLERGPLFRVTVFTRGEADHVLLLSMHHIIADLWSVLVLMRELGMILEGEVGLPLISGSHRQFVDHQEKMLSGPEGKRLWTYWQAKLAAPLPQLELPTRGPRPLVFTEHGASLAFPLGTERSEAIIARATRTGTTPFTVLLSVYGALLGRYGGSDDVLVGSPVSGRSHAFTADLVGDLVNPTVLRIDLSGDPTAAELTERVSSEARASLTHGEYPFPLLVERLQPERDPSRPPLVQVLFSFQNPDQMRDLLPFAVGDPDARVDLGGLALTPYPLRRRTTRFEIALEIAATPRGYAAILEYNTDLFEQGTMARFRDHFIALTDRFLEDGQRAVSAADILSAGERASLLDAWHDVEDGVAICRPVHQSVSARALERPESIALGSGEDGLTYARLKRRLDRLAEHLIACGVGPGDVVGICLPRNHELAIAILAVLESGACFVPMDPSFPAERLAYMLRDSGARLLIADRETGAPFDDIQKLYSDDEAFRGESRDGSPGPEVGPDALAYIIYTSGSTGRPKGVEVRHGGLANLIAGVADLLETGPDDTLLAVTTISFDIAYLELFLPLTQGAGLILADAETAADGQRLAQRLACIKPSLMQATPITWRLLHEAGWRGDAGLTILCGGEALEPGLAARLARENAALWNLYGPTETTIWSTADRIELRGADGRVTIGRPLANQRACVLGPKSRLEPVGVPGKLYLAGAGLARGYHGRPALTAAVFTPDPFSSTPGARLYDTGDLARTAEDGRLIYMGRADHQIKLRGYRIETGEIETLLSRLEGIDRVVVTLWTDPRGASHLVAYVRLDPECEIQREVLVADLMAHAREHLPGYMIPAFFVRMDSFPLTPNGKLDRKALPVPERADSRTRGGYVAPRNETERVLAGLWQDVLALDPVGIEDDFFDIGGHSLSATQLLFRINARFGARLTLRDFFAAGTIAGLARRLGEAGASPDALPVVVADPENRYAPFPLSEIQQAYWLGRQADFELGNVGTHIYLEIEGRDLDLDRFEDAFNHLILRHDMLRAVISDTGEQRVLETVPRYEIDRKDVGSASREAVAETLREARQAMSHRVLSTDRWPVFEIRATLHPGGTRLHLSFDALITDAWSNQLLQRELVALYRDPDHVLPPLSLTFRDYLQTERSLESTGLYTRAHDYWTDRIDALSPAPELPQAVSPAAIGTPRFHRHEHFLEPALWQTIGTRAEAAGLTPTSVLLTVFGRVLAAWSKNPSFTLNLTLFSRLPLHEEVNDIVGDFTTLLLLEIHDAGAEPLIDAGRRLQEQLWADLDHRVVSGVRVLRELGRRRGTQAATMPVVFTSLIGGGGNEVIRELGEEVYGITQTPQVQLDHVVMERDGGLYYYWDVVEALFPEGMIASMFEATRALLIRLATSEDAWRQPRLDILPASQLAARLEANATAAPISENLLHQGFLNKAAERPRAVALVDAEGSLDYGSLHALAAELAARLRAQGLQPGERVGILLEKGRGQAVATLAVLIAGGAYLPISTELPQERRRYLMDQGDVRKVISTASWEPGIREVGRSCFFIAEEIPTEIPATEPVVTADELAYIIFTSGSTGFPKGVAIDHRGAVNTNDDINRRFDVGPDDRVLALSALNFDLSVYDLFGMLAAGGTIVMPAEEDAKDPAAWLPLMARHGVTFWNTVPALMQLLVDYLEEKAHPAPPGLRLVMMSGDWIPVSLPDRIKRAWPGADIYSFGGATEASIWSIFYPIGSVDPGWKSIPYGKPMVNQTFHVLDGRLEPRPVWVPGNLYIGGIGLARCYWGDPEKTAASFITHPRTGERLYRTGDLGRYLPDGNIEFLGRDDFQVKIRGYRIELGEIEHFLDRHPAIHRSVVIVHQGESSAKRLVAYLQPTLAARETAAELEPDRLRAYLREHVPDYMVPPLYTILETIPLTANGKVDRQALPEPDDEASHRVLREPETETERVLAEILAEQLGLKQISIDDNFFDLGADSVLAIKMLSRLRDSFSMPSLSLRDLLAYPTVTALSARIDASRASAQANVWPLTPEQQAIWFRDVTAETVSVFNRSVFLRGARVFGMAQVGAAVARLTERHETLRTVFEVDGDRVVARIVEPANSFPEIDEVDLRDHENGLTAAEADAFSRNLVPMDLSVAPLVRATVYHLADADSLLMLEVHAIAADPTSLEILADDLIALLADEEPAAATGYRALVEVPDSVRSARTRAFWLETLRGISEGPVLATDRSRPSVQGHRSLSHEFASSPETAAAFRAACGDHDPMIGLHTLFAVLLMRAGGCDELVIGLPVARRSERVNVVGPIDNTVAIRHLRDAAPFTELIARTSARVDAARAHADFPLDRVIEALKLDPDAGYHPLFRTAFTSEPSATGRGDLIRYLPQCRVTELDLVLSVTIDDTGIRGAFYRDVDLFDASTVTRMIRHFRMLVEAVAADPAVAPARISLLSDAERDRVLHSWNATELVFEEDGCLHHLFERQVDDNPHRTALIDGETRLDYAALDARANALAHALLDRGVTAETPVGFLARGGLDCVVVPLAIAKAGAVYVPLDPAHPPARLRFLLEDTGTGLVVSRGGIAALGEGYRGSALDLDALGELAESRPELPVSAERTAYIMFTSGSTGKPKGVRVAHRAIGNRLRWARAVYPMDERDRFLQLASFSFDISIWEIMAPLISGGTLVMSPPGVYRDPARLAATIETMAITAVHFVPSMMQNLLQTAPDALRGVRLLFCGGEAMSAELMGRLLAATDAACHHFYGPTEAAINVTAWDCRSGDGRVSIGRPIANTRLYVLDETLEPVPVGLWGQLYLAGRSLARGYHRRAAVTAENFIPDPFADSGGERLYRTGDLVRYRDDGNLEFKGRIDTQQKLRGVRIEPGEIESVVKDFGGILEAVAAIREDRSEQQLVVYLVREPGDDAALLEGLRAFLRERLPAYMMPNRFVFLERLPLTPNGKLDRAALPAPEDVETESVDHVAPRDETEQVLAEIWADVMKRDRVSIEADFFALGGHSLMATQIISRIKDRLGCELAMATLFENPTIAAVGRRIVAGEATAETTHAIVPVPREGHLPLSFAQEGMWVFDQLEGPNAIYNVTFPLHLRGMLDVTLLVDCFTEILRRHEALRATFPVIEGEPVQVINPVDPRFFSIIDLRGLDERLREARRRRLVREETAHIFPLAEGPLFRVRLLLLSEFHCLLIVNNHHIVSDGWSNGIMVEELKALYEAFAAGQPSPLPELPFQYVDFAVWQRHWLTGSVRDRQLSYWKNKLAGAPTLLDLPLDYPRPAERRHHGKTLTFLVEPDQTARIKQLTHSAKSTLFMTLQTAFVVLLSRYAGSDDILIGTPVANRNRGDIEAMIGFFLNTLVLRTDLSGDPSVRALIEQVRDNSFEAYGHQDLPFEHVLEAVDVERSLSHTPLYQVLFIYQNTPMGTLGLPGLTIEAEQQDVVAHFDLTLVMMETPAGIEGYLGFNTDIFAQPRIERMIGHFHTLLDQMARAPEQPISRLSILTDAERQTLLRDWNDTDADTVPHQPFRELFHASVARWGNEIAAEMAEDRLTYDQLSARVRRLANALAAKGIGPNRLVGLLGDRDFDFLTSILAVFEVGAAYLPLDPKHPVARTARVLDRADASMVLVGPGHEAVAEDVLALLPETRQPLLMAMAAGLDAPAVMPAADPDHLAYVIFTSGSTGTPKGAMVVDKGMVNHLYAKITDLAMDARDVLAQNAPQSFDISVWQFLAALLTGGRVRIFADEIAHDAVRLLDETASRGVTVLEVVPSLMRFMLEEIAARGERAPDLSALRYLVPTGEALPPNLATAWLRRYPAIPVVNAYGPTECSDDVTHFRLESPPPASVSTISIGKPLVNLKVHVLDRCFQPAPIGVPGEVVVSGIGVGRGYIAEPRITAETFVPNPYATGRDDIRLYKTGDLARFMPDGNLELIGRVDFQVKVRGFRIELGEIEARLAEHARVKRAVVIAHEDDRGNKRLAGYVEMRAGEDEDVAALLRAHLADKLPDYMVPSFFVALGAFPLTPNGKIDRKALPAPDPAASAAGMVAPRNPTEALMASMWSDVLGIEAIGVTDNFFDLGGHSLMATQLAARIRKVFGVALPLRDVFSTPTIAALSASVDAATSGTREAIPRRTVTGALPLSHAQQRVWLMHTMISGDTSFNLPCPIALHGRVDVPALGAAFTALVARHEILRTTFSIENGQPAQIVGEAGPFDLVHTDLSDLDEAERDTEMNRLRRGHDLHVFDLARGPLLEAVLVTTSATEHLLLINLHHIVTDGWSMGILFSELVALYRAASAGQGSPLPELPIQYGDYALWQRGRPAETLEDDIAYWRKQLAGLPLVQELPMVETRPAEPDFTAHRREMSFSRALTERIGTLARAHDVTPFMVLLAAWSTVMSYHTGEDDIVVGTDVANRTRVELEPLIGFFINQLVLRNDLSGDPSFAGLLERVRETTLSAFAHEELPFDKLVAELAPERKIQLSPYFQVKLVYQNTPVGTVSLDELTLEPLPVPGEAAKLDLVLLFGEREGCLRGMVDYRTDLYQSAGITRLLRHYETVLEAACIDPDVTLSGLHQTLRESDEQRKREKLHARETSGAGRFGKRKPVK